MINTEEQLLVSSISRLNGANPLTVITGMKYNSNLVKAFNNMTFFYDPNWTYEKGNPTYPLAFFYVKSMTESMTSDISQKPLMFYDAGSTESASSGVMSIISDNIITKPKIYKLEVLVPMNVNDMYYNKYGVASTSRSYVESFILGQQNSYNTGIGSSIQFYTRSAEAVLRQLFTTLYGTNLSASTVTTMLCSQQDYNKNSIEYMWRNRRIIKMKMWNGWSFKYLAILDTEITKTGENGNYYEGTITCQEVPIMVVKPNVNTVSLGWVGKASSWVGTQIKTVVGTFINSMEAIADDGKVS